MQIVEDYKKVIKDEYNERMYVTEFGFSTDKAKEIVKML